MAKEGSTVSGLMDSFACRRLPRPAARRAAQAALREVRPHSASSPAAGPRTPNIGYAKSIMDYIFRWLQLRFLTGQQLALFDGLAPQPEPAPTVATSQTELEQGMGRTSAPQGALPTETNYPITDSPIANLGVRDRGLIQSHHASDAMKEFVDMGDAPSCHVCGAIMTRNGSCYRCMSCGSTSGCS